MLVRDVLSDVRRSVQYRRAAQRAAKARAAGTPKILVIGICQGAAVAQAMSLLLPEADVTFVSAFEVAARYPRLADLTEEAKRNDITFTNSWLPAFKGGGTLADLRNAARVVEMPTIVFAAFHPDQVRVGAIDRPESGGLLGPLGHAHSALAVFGYLEGLGIEPTLKLFDEEIYHALGYFRMWGPSVKALIGLGQLVGYDLQEDLALWSRQGCFMHSDNHPKMFVAADLARGLLRKAGINCEPCDLDSYLQDSLMGGGTWPVYPPIARHYGVKGNSLFLKVETPGTGPARTLTLRQFVAASFARYDRAGRDALVCDRVAGWRADADARELLRAKALSDKDA